MTWILAVTLCLNGHCHVYAAKTFATEQECIAAAKHRHRPSALYSNPYNFCIFFGDQA